MIQIKKTPSPWLAVTPAMLVWSGVFAMLFCTCSGLMALSCAPRD